MVAFDIAFAQFKEGQKSKLEEAIELLKVVIDIDKVYYGNRGSVTLKDVEHYIKLQLLNARQLS